MKTTVTPQSPRKRKRKAETPLSSIDDPTGKTSKRVRVTGQAFLSQWLRQGASASQKQQVGQIRVGTIRYEAGKKILPSYPGFTPIEVMTKCSKYGSLSPYALKDDRGRLMENLWQFAKIYSRVPAVTQYKSRYDRTIIWSHPAEHHWDHKKNQPNLAYWAWREKGMQCEEPIRYPVGFASRHLNILGSIVSDRPLVAAEAEAGRAGASTGPGAGAAGLQLLGYIDARKQIYLLLYQALVQSSKQFLELQARLAKGENLLIMEVDGPQSHSLSHYCSLYGIPTDWIQKNTLLATTESLSIMLHDPRHPFGHGYCLAAVLLGITESILVEPVQMMAAPRSSLKAASAMQAS